MLTGSRPLILRILPQAVTAPADPVEVPGHRKKRKGTKSKLKTSNRKPALGRELSLNPERSPSPRKTGASPPSPTAWGRKVVQVHGKPSKAKRWLVEDLNEEMDEFYFDKDLFEGRYNIIEHSIRAREIFFDDTLCKNCKSLFEKTMIMDAPENNLRRHDKNLDNACTLDLDLRQATRCPLCGLLQYRFQHAPPSGLHSLTIKYWLSQREGIRNGGLDLTFQLERLENVSDVSTVRLAVLRRDYESLYQMDFGTNPSLSLPLYKERDDWVKDEASAVALKGHRAAKWMAICLASHKTCRDASAKGHLDFPAEFEAMLTSLRLENWEIAVEFPLKQKLGLHDLSNSDPSLNDFLPKRLLEISKRNDTSWNVRLRGTHYMDSRTPYATLSHCWGGSVPFKLTQKNLRNCKKRIPFTQLSKTFQHAIQMAHCLGFGFLWIDSLCIIQDSQDDWRTESAVMGNIYRCCTLNIAATGFRNGKTGIFVPNIRYVNYPINLKLEKNIEAMYSNGSIGSAADAGNYTLFALDTWHRGVEAAPFNSRGWVLQERALSLRTLHFGEEQMFWECLELSASEIFPAGMVAGTKMRQPKSAIRPEELDEAESIAYDTDYGLDKEPLSSATESTEHDSGAEAVLTDLTSGNSGSVDVRAKGLRSEGAETLALQTSILLELRSWLTKGRGMFYPGTHSHISSLDLDTLTKDLDWDILGSRRLRGFNIWLKNAVRKSSKIHAGIYPTIPWKGMTRRQEQWLEVIQAYSGCNLTYESDKLVAISGIARMMKKEMNCQYMAGMWRRDLEHQLLWKVSQGKESVHRFRVPSWSWTSVDAPVRMSNWGHDWETDRHLKKITWLASVVNAEADLLTKDEFGPLRSGRLTLIGPLGLLRIWKTGQNQEWLNRAFYSTQHPARMFFDTAFPLQSGTLGDTTTFRTHINAGSEMDPYWIPADLDIFYMPVRLMDEAIDGKTAEHPILKGLLLAPTGERHGEYYRIGMFESSDAWDGHCVQALRCNRTNIYSSKYFVSKSKNCYTIDVI